jgi:hypothetical protein
MYINQDDDKTLLSHHHHHLLAKTSKMMTAMIKMLMNIVNDKRQHIATSEANEDYGERGQHFLCCFLMLVDCHPCCHLATTQQDDDGDDNNNGNGFDNGGDDIAIIGFLHSSKHHSINCPNWHVIY